MTNEKVSRVAADDGAFVSPRLYGTQSVGGSVVAHSIIPPRPVDRTSSPFSSLSNFGSTPQTAPDMSGNGDGGLGTSSEAGGVGNS